MIESNAFDEIIDFLAGYEPQRILNFHPSKKTQKRVEKLVNKKHNKKLTKKEKRELDYFLMLAHIIRMAKARALKSVA